MAKGNVIKIKLASTADTGYFYVTKKNSRTKTEKFAFKKYDGGAQACGIQGNEDQVIFRSTVIQKAPLRRCLFLLECSSSRKRTGPGLLGSRRPLKTVPDRPLSPRLRRCGEPDPWGNG
jgi:large subunit ribosomal protein L33